MGYAAWRLDVERLMAATAVQKLLYCWAHGNRGALLYCSRDIGGPRMSAGDWGTVDHFLCPRFMYGAVAAFIDVLAGTGFGRVVEETRQRHAFEFRDGDRVVVALYAPDNQSRRVVLETDAAQGELTDAMGNRRTVEARRLPVMLSAYPVYLELQQPTRIALGDEEPSR